LTLRAAAGGRQPGLIGLCEVGSENAGVQVGEAIGGAEYANIWSGAPPGQETGLLILYNRRVFQSGPIGRIDEDTRGGKARVRWMAARLECLEALQGSLWFVVHHWPSPRSGEDASLSRQNLWAEFNSFYKREARPQADAMIVTGDFNCEPGDFPLVNQPDQVLVTTRQRDIVLGRVRAGLFLYNPMWRLMVEEHPYEETLVEGYTSDRPLGTRRAPGVGWRMLDQMFISAALLRGPYFQFLEGTLRVCRPFEACSDHSAIGATVQIKEKT
jgi:exonuclease III